MEYLHKSVLLNEAINGLNIKKNGVYIDATGGAGGHAAEILKNLSCNGKLIILDRDPDAYEVLKNRFTDKNNVNILNINFSELDVVLNLLNIESIDGILMDLGVSSYQIDNKDRGFCYKNNTVLDMRMDKIGTSAMDIVNNYTIKALSKLLKNYGEEKYAYNIAKNIEKYRITQKIETTNQLTSIIEMSIPAFVKRRGNLSKKVFQAIRIEVNSELDFLIIGLQCAFKKLSTNGRFCIITFHSLEDRIVKKTFKNFVGCCNCPSDFPICLCSSKISAKIITKKAILPSNEEYLCNKRSKSAKLRILEKL